MIWTLTDGTEIEVTDHSDGHSIYVNMPERGDLWDMIDNVVKVKDLSSFTLTDALGDHVYDGMVFVGITVCDIDADDNTMVLKFGADVVVANSRLLRENAQLTERLIESEDKVNGYDILTGGM